MALTSKRLELAKGVGLNIIETDKFKSNLLTLNIIRPLEREEVTLNALLPMVLERGSSSLTSKLIMERRLEEMYGSDLSIGSTKRGERQIIKASIEWADSLFTEETDLSTDAVKLLMDVFFKPLIEDNSFKTIYVDQEKINLISKIRNRINDKRNYAISRCIEEMCKGEKFGIYGQGYEDDAAEIDGESLLSHYNELLKTSPIEIFYVGRTGDIDFEGIISEYISSRDNIIDIPREIIPKNNFNRNQVVEKLPVAQGKLVLGLRSSIPYEDSLYNGLLLGNEIFGGTPNSHLFKIVREEKSLAYYATSSLIKHKSIIIADAGIEFSNYKQTLDLMNEQLKRIKSGDFSDEDINIAKKSIINSSEAIVDSSHMISEFFLGKLLARDDRSLEDMIKDVNSVIKDDIVSAMNSVSLDTIYFIEGSKEVQHEEDME